MDLQSIRTLIDRQDTEIFQNIGKRLQLVKKVVQWKKENGVPIFDAEREELIISQKREMAERFGFSADTAEEIIRALIAESHLQEKQFLENDETSPRKVRRKKIKSHPSLFQIFEQMSKTEKNFFFLESLGDDEWSHRTFLGANPKKVFAAKGNDVFIDGKKVGEVENPLEWLQEQFLPYQHLVENTRSKNFVGGLVGHLNFESVRYWEKTLHLESHPDFYDFEFGLFLDGLVYDRKTEELEYVFADEDRSQELQHMFAQIQSEDDPYMTEYQGSNFSDEGLDQMIEECKTEIEAGNVFQIVPSRSFSYQFSGSDVSFYKRLRESNPSPNMFFIHFEERRLIGSSPEMIAKTQGKRIETYPIAGTRSRGTTPQEDAILSAEMLSDEKEVAEHLMLVDMARNDLGRVCEYGSVKVEETMALKKYSHVQHLVSRVVGKMKEGVSSLDAALANFPMGTVVGSPRIEALKILERLENSPRGPYAGGVGYWSINGDLQLSLAIRSFFLSGEKGFAQAGAGVVFDSVPKNERKEIEKKSMNIRSLLD